MAFTGLAIADITDDHLPDIHRLERGSMDKVEDRIASFINWPHGGRLRPVFMAGAGFFQCNEGTDAVSCFTCNVEMVGWNDQVDPTTEHRRASPTCSWNNDTYMTTWDERLGSFHTWPLDIKPLPALMASAGFYHSNKATDSVTCFSCKLNLKDWKKSDDPIQQHLQQSSMFRPCAWISEVTNQPTLYTPPTPPSTPPLSASIAIPHKCEVCQKTFPSGNQFRKHRRQSHNRIGRRVGVPLGRPGVVLLGRYKVSKATRQRTRTGRRGNTDLFGRD